MSKKPKFNPEVTMVKLNPEQAVLYCTCIMVSGTSKVRTATTTCQATKGARVCRVTELSTDPSS